MIKKLVEHVVKQIVEKPEAVTIIATQTEGKTHLAIDADQADRGKVIGRQGQTIKAIRMLVSAVAPQGKKFTIDIAK